MGAVAVSDGGGEHTYSGRGDAQLSGCADAVVGGGKDHAHVSGHAAGRGGTGSGATGEYVFESNVDRGGSFASRAATGVTLPTDEPLRSHGEHGSSDVLRGTTERRRGTADWAADLEHAIVRAGPGDAAGAGGGSRGVVYRGSKPGTRLSPAAGTDGGEIRCQSVPQRGRGPALQDRRLSSLPRRWSRGVPRTNRRPGEDPRLPDRTGRDRRRIGTA